MNFTIWHNPKCSKSREAVNLLNEKGIEVSVVKYLETIPTKEDIKDLLAKLGISAKELIRSKEDIYKELDLKNESDEEKLIEAMVTNPKLIERPILMTDTHAIIGRPPEKILELL
jgi:arsenate reductase (glutaredoxin)